MEKQEVQKFSDTFIRCQPPARFGQIYAEDIKNLEIGTRLLIHNDKFESYQVVSFQGSFQGRDLEFHDKSTGWIKILSRAGYAVTQSLADMGAIAYSSNEWNRHNWVCLF